jgi:hypothetical protein
MSKIQLSGGDAEAVYQWLCDNCKISALTGGIEAWHKPGAMDRAEWEDESSRHLVFCSAKCKTEFYEREAQEGKD